MRSQRYCYSSGSSSSRSRERRRHSRRWRVGALPDVPTFKELGYPDAEFYIWAGVFAPKGTPEPVLAKLRETLRAAVGDPDFKAAMDKLETPIVFKQGDEFARFFETDARRLAAGVRKVGRIEAK